MVWAGESQPVPSVHRHGNMVFSTATDGVELPSHVESHLVAFDDLPHALTHMQLYRTLMHVHAVAIAMQYWRQQAVQISQWISFKAHCITQHTKEELRRSRATSRCSPASCLIRPLLMVGLCVTPRDALMDIRYCKHGTPHVWRSRSRCWWTAATDLTPLAVRE